MPETMSYIQAVNRALDWALASRTDTVLFGEDIAIPGGPFGATKNLYGRYGASRIFDTPISETGFLGMALGAAMTGMRPIAEIMYADFLFVAMDQVVNQIANTRYVSRGGWQAPLVIRTQQGHSVGSCAQHSQSIEAYLTHTPGLRVAAPASPQDAYQLLRAAVSSDDPVVVLEARMLYPVKGEVDVDSPVEDIGGARIVRPGNDLTIVSWSRGVGLALSAAQRLQDEGIDAEVIDLRWLAPWDVTTVTQSVSRTGRLVVVHEANETGGFGAEVAARVTRDCFGVLRAPVERVAPPDVPMPASPALQEAVLPDAERIIEAVRRTMGWRE